MGDHDTRIVLIDQPGEPIEVRTYDDADAPTIFKISPDRALALAADLIEGARRRLPQGALGNGR